MVLWYHNIIEILLSSASSDGKFKHNVKSHRFRSCFIYIYIYIHRKIWIFLILWIYLKLQIYFLIVLADPGHQLLWPGTPLFEWVNPGSGLITMIVSGGIWMAEREACAAMWNHKMSRSDFSVSWLLLFWSLIVLAILTKNITSWI